MHPRISRHLYAGSFYLFTTLSLHAQVDSGTITGTVRDPSGGLIAGATILVTNKDEKTTTSFSTNNGGAFTAASLRPGAYSVTVSAPGFGTVERDAIDLRIQDRIGLDIALPLGSTATSVAVSAAPPELETEASSVGDVVEHQTVESLPLNGRNPVQLATLTPGTSPSQRTQERNSFISNGQRSIQNSYLLDGIDNKNKIVGFDNSAAESIEPFVDAVQEFKVQTASFSAEFGQSAGAVVNETIRSGGSSFHGSVFEFLRNSALDASPFFQPALTSKPQFIQNQYGATLGGPILPSHRTFFFFGWQSSRTIDAAPQLATVPTAAQIEGQFSTPIYDPATTTPASSGSGYTRSLFVNNEIPTSRFDPVAAKLLALFPGPNLQGKYNFFSNQMERVNNDQYIGRIDEALTERDSIFGHYIASFSENVLPAPLPPPASNPSLVAPEAHSFVASWTHILNGNLVNEARVGYQETREQQNIQSARLFEQYGILGAPNISKVTGLPVFSPTGFTSIGTTGPGTLQTAATGSGNLPIDKQGRTIQASENLSWQRGRHALKFGADFQQVTLYANVTLNARPTYSFSGVYTQNPAGRSGTGNPFADFLLGETSSSTVSTASDSESRQHIYQGYVQDDWRAARKLTVNAGVRYEVPLPFYETSNHYSDVILDPGALYGQLVQADQASADGYSRSFVRANLRDIAPRLGFAYALDDQTVVHAAFGIFYARDENVPVARRPTNNPPYFIQTNYTSDEIDPSIVLAQGFPANAITSGSGSIPAVNSYPPSSPTPYVEQWTLNWQHQLPNGLTAQLGYVGSGTRKLYYPLQIDQPAPGPGNIQARRPLPEYSAVYEYGPFVGGNYNALQAQLERRYSHGLYLLAAYTWGHAIDNGDSQTDNTPAPQNAYDLQAQRGDSNYDIRNRFVLSAVYQVPFGHGHALFSHGISSAALGGWTLKGIFSAQTGLPFTPVESVDQSNTGTTARPNRIGSGDLPSGKRGVSEWFNTAAFPTPAQYTFGDSGRDILSGPSLRNLDFALSRTVPIREQVHVELRLEGFNVLNTPQFGLPNATLGTSTAGAISTVANPQREVQAAARIAF